MEKKDSPVSDNLIVAALPALLGDKKKLRVLLAVAAVLFLLLLALAFLTTG